MPIYPFVCPECGKEVERILPINAPAPECCGTMTRIFSGSLTIKTGPPIWVSRIDEIHKAQADRGEKLTLPHPKEVRAT